MAGRTIIIAEAGVNHNGSLENARKLVDAAVEAGVDYVKFQTFKAEKIASSRAVKAEYQQASTNAQEGQQAMLKRLELSDAAHKELQQYCASKNIEFLSTPFDLDSIDLLKSMGITMGKIPSGEITNLPYLQKMAQAFPILVLSTGMADMDEIGAALKVLLDEGIKKENITILHCNTEYPTPMKDVNLTAMNTIGNEFGVKIGYSDHTLGIEVPVAAVALGATLIEKHFTLDKTMEGPDHKASLDPQELKAMTQAIRNIELAMGNGVKEASESERKNKVIARKSIIAARTLKAGKVLTADDLVMKRPGNGISPMELYSVVGKTLKVDVEFDTLISYSHFE